MSKAPKEVSKSYRKVRNQMRPAARRLKHVCPLCETPVQRGEVYVESVHADVAANRMRASRSHAECFNELASLVKEGETGVALGLIPLDHRVPSLVSGWWNDKELSPHWRSWIARRIETSNNGD